MKTYHGSCHCGDVKYKIIVDISRVTRCTCSICTKKGILLARVKPEDLTIIEGADKLQLYQFNEMIAKHYFCPTCGIHTHGNPRAAPDMFIVNVNTLDDFDVHSETPEVRIFDGRNWEKAFAENQRRG
jgi:hypothetical protein